MKNILFASIALCTVLACSSSEEPLQPGTGAPVDPGDAAVSLEDGAVSASPNGQESTGTGSEDNTQHHMDDPTAEGNPNSTNVEEKKRDEQAIGTANVVARLHACGKLSYASIGKFLVSRGVDPAAGSAATLFNGGRSALGVANYQARIAEAAFPSTAAYARLFDIYVAAAPQIYDNLQNSTACPGVAAVDAETGRLTRDAISCLVGVPATDAHVAAANLLVDQFAGDYEGREREAIELGIAALLTSHQLCQ